MLSSSSVSFDARSRAAVAVSFSRPPSYEPISLIEGCGSGGLGVGSSWEDVVEAIVSVGDFDLDSEGFTGAIFGLVVWLRVEEGCFLMVVAVLFVGTNLGL